MTDLVVTAPGQVSAASTPTTDADTSAGVLPSPLFDANPQDAMAMLLMSVERSAQENINQTRHEVEHTQARSREAQQQVIRKLKEALAAAAKAREEAKDDGGWFGKIVNTVASAVSVVVEFQRDMAVAAVKTPYEAGKALVKGENLAQNLQSVIKEFEETSDLGQGVEGAIAGTARFAMDYAEFALKATVASATGDLQALEDAGKDLLESFRTNILENEDLMYLVEKSVQAAMVGGALATGGLTAIVVIGVMTVMEADKQTNFLENTLGKEGALGARLALTAALVAAGGDLDTATRVLAGGASVLQGAADFNAGIRERERADKRARVMEANANLQEALNELKALQRVIDTMLGALEEKQEHQTRTRSLSSDIVQTQAAANSAVVMRA